MLLPNTTRDMNAVFAALVLTASGTPALLQGGAQDVPPHPVIEASISDADRADLGVVGSVAFARAGQLIVVAEIRPVRVRVFDRSLRPLRQLGREGSGPGEYRRPVVTANGDSAIVYDAGLGRVHVFSATGGAVVDSWTTQVQFSARGEYRAMVAVDDNGRIILHAGRLTQSRGPAEAYVRFGGSRGRIQDTLLVTFGTAPVINPLERAAVFRAGDAGAYVRARLRQFFPEPLHDVNGGHWVSWAGTGPDVLRGRSSAATPAAVSLPVSSIGGAQRDARERRIVSALTGQDIPEQELRKHARESGVFDQVPLLEGLFVDRIGRIWAWQEGRHPDSLLVTAIEPSGALAVRLTISRGQWRARDVAGNDLVMAGADDSTGEPLLIRARLAGSRGPG